MLLRRKVLDAITRGDVDLAFRRWRRPTVRSGGTLLTASGQLRIGRVSVVDPDAITAEEATRAGYDSTESLLAELARNPEGRVFRIELDGLQPDPRAALREAPVNDRQIADLRARLARLDAVSAEGPWTVETLRAIRRNPGLRAGDLCRHVDQERDRFKTNVRKLKNLGLTESLEVGYRLSPRGESYLDYSDVRSNLSIT